MGDPLGAAPGAALDAEAGGGRRDLKQVSDGGGCRKRRNARLRLGPGDMAEQPCSRRGVVGPGIGDVRNGGEADEAIFDRERDIVGQMRSEEHTSELQSLMRISYAVFCLKKKQKQR